jgi:hypothetical protein
MCCSARTTAITLRHDVLLHAWRRIAHRAGVSTAGEPAMDRLRNAAPCYANSVSRRYSEISRCRIILGAL